MVWDRKQSRNYGHVWLDSNVSTLKNSAFLEGDIFSGFQEVFFSVIFQESD